MPKISSALLAIVLICGVASSADARKRRASHSYQDDYSARSDSNQGRRTITSGETQVSGRVVSGGGAFGAIVDELVRGCAERGAELAHWPFEDIVRIAEPDELQRRALEALRAAAEQVAGRLTLDCPQEVPAALSARLEAVEQGIDVTLAAFARLQPTLQAFYSALDDEQKARLLRDRTMSTPTVPSTERTREATYQRLDGRSSDRRERRSRGRAYAQARGEGDTESNKPLDGASRTSVPNLGAGSCENFASALRRWPVGDVERNVELSEKQRVPFYEFVTASLKAADILATACPAVNALTPVRRMETMLARLAAVRAAAAAIRPALMRFYGALDEGQKVRFVEMS
jgi:LTXXQ motif family protein